MTRTGGKGTTTRWHGGLTAFLAACLGLAEAGCARLPYVTTTVHEDARVAVTLQREMATVQYSHPATLEVSQVAGVLRGLSLREQPRLPLRWFAEETPPNTVFRDDELQVLAPWVARALSRAKDDERVAFQVFAPGFNPRYARDVTAGWVALRGQYLHVTIEQFHTQQPIRSSDAYDYNYPTPPSPPKSYLLYFEPGRVYVTDPATGTRAVDLHEFLKAGLLP